MANVISANLLLLLEINSILEDTTGKHILLVVEAVHHSINCMIVSTTSSSNCQEG